MIDCVYLLSQFENTLRWIKSKQAITPLGSPRFGNFSPQRVGALSHTKKVILINAKVVAY